MAVFLVLQAARFGDVVQTGRLLQGLAARGQVHLAVDENLVALARLLYPFARIHGLCLHGRDEQGFLLKNTRVLEQWRHEHFSAVYNCNFSGLTAALCRIFEPEQVQGFRPAPGGIWRSPWARV
ncbi:heptosyltransferase, partial [Desulfovibrio sp. 1188_IL3213]